VEQLLTERYSSPLGEANDPLLYVERKAYLDALGCVLSRVEEARVVLPRARQRLEEGRAA
jgi:hypothetical protein